MSPQRQLDLHGSITGRNEAGRSFDVQCEGARITINSHNARAALAALSTLRTARANGGFAALSPLAPWATSRISDFELHLHLRDRAVGRAGQGANPNWLGRTLTRLPIEMHWRALVLAVLTAF